MGTWRRYFPEVRQRAFRLVFEHKPEYDSQWAAIGSIAAKTGCTAQTLGKWVRQAERNQGWRAGVTSTERRIDWFNHRRLLELLGRVSYRWRPDSNPDISGKAGAVRR